MSRAFSAGPAFRVRDGTLVRPLLNALDARSGLPPDLLDDFSIAVGDLEPGRRSKIHVHPLVTQVTIVIAGKLEVTLKDPGVLEPFSLTLEAVQAALVEPRAFLQLYNPASRPCRVLYVVCPAYILDVDPSGSVRYEDAISLTETWDELRAANWQPPGLLAAGVTPDARHAAAERMRHRH